jgi:hypothetical protein
LKACATGRKKTGGGLAHIGVLGVFGDAHNRGIDFGRGKIAALRDVSTKGIAASEVVPRESFVDDGYFGRAFVIVPRELAPGHESSSHGAEVAGADHVEIRIAVLVPLVGVAFHGHARPPIASRDRRDDGAGGRGHAGNRGDLL